METTIVYWGYIGIMEKKMETTIVYWGYIGIEAATSNLPSLARSYHIGMLFVMLFGLLLQGWHCAPDHRPGTMW